MLEDLHSVNRPTPIFLDAPSGKLFSIFYPLSNGNTPQHVVLHVPASFEEMNKARAMVALQSRHLAEQGISVLVIDLFGTGDSQGDFSEARWDIWHSDLDWACRWLCQMGITSLSLWALRLGALLAIDFASKSSLEFKHLMLWQPVLNGEIYLMQFLRLRVAAGLFSSNKAKETTTGLKARLQAQESIEVAGYDLNPRLANTLIGLKADKLNSLHCKHISILEVVAGKDSEVSIANQKFASSLQTEGAGIHVDSVVGEPFWATTEISLAKALLERTSSALSAV